MAVRPEHPSGLPFLRSVSLFDLRTVSPSRPARAPGRRAQTPSKAGRRDALATSSPLPGHALTVASTASGCPRSGRIGQPILVIGSVQLSIGRELKQNSDHFVGRFRLYQREREALDESRELV
jgi:hypothetical protein